VYIYIYKPIRVYKLSGPWCLDSTSWETFLIFLPTYFYVCLVSIQSQSTTEPEHRQNSSCVCALLFFFSLSLSLSLSTYRSNIQPYTAPHTVVIFACVVYIKSLFCFAHLLAGLICRELFLYPSVGERERDVSVIAVSGQLFRYKTDKIWLSQTRELAVDRRIFCTEDVFN